MNEYYPDLMERVIRREPNAYLAALYWDSEMFGRSSRKRKESEQGQEQKDYKQELINLFDHMEIFDTPHKPVISLLQYLLLQHRRTANIFTRV